MMDTQNVTRRTILDKFTKFFIIIIFFLNID